MEGGAAIIELRPYCYLIRSCLRGGQCSCFFHSGSSTTASVTIRFLRRMALKGWNAFTPAWQWIPTYRCDPRADPFLQGEYPGLSYTRCGYSRMAEYAEQNRMGRTFSWCADIQRAITEPLYLDAAHYSPTLSKMVAGCIANGVVEKNFLE